MMVLVELLHRSYLFPAVVEREPSLSSLAPTYPEGMTQRSGRFYRTSDSPSTGPSPCSSQQCVLCPSI